MAGRPRFALVVVAVAVLATPVAASATVNSTPASSWQTNGRVRAVVVAAHKIFIGGDFTMVRAPGTSSGGVARNHLAALSLTTGKLMPWNPRANGTVTALRVNPAGTTIYIGGGFTTVLGRSRIPLAAVTTSETKLREWHANTDGTVSDVKVLKSVNPLLDAAAERAVSHWTYRPATLNGRSVSVYLTVTVNFQLH